MTQVDAQYRQQAHSAAINICSQVLPMDKLPTALKEAYDNLFEQLLEDKESEFKQAWDKLPPSAAKLLPRADFHGFFIASAWLQLSLMAQDIAQLADTDKAIAEQEYSGIYDRISQSALKESVRKLKKARTDRRLLNSIRDVIANG
ncbi:MULTISPECIES: DUF3069 domain-containing protein [Shewanella]|uniref:DUF3069 domain-containing protein n=1 Tax=Shewanella carassii TaxID=1987584 RepID=A0ABQ1T0R7_9GAMM|nr:MULTISPECIES: DUF3069 domain-containing protein [Shewanella]TVP11092.1 hypothetical protein AYI96_10990 [Shewanella sp. MSW]GGE73763.1 hypothetical protein GCM10011520_12930 [Shewanella carassii]